MNMNKYWIGALIGSLLTAGVIYVWPVHADMFPYANPLFAPVPVDLKTGSPLNGISQEQNDMTMLYGKLEVIEDKLNQLLSRS